MFNGLLPAGSVVSMKNGKKRLMIIGTCVQDANDRVFDYAACMYPEGVISLRELFLVNNDDIEKIFFVGYQDDSQFSYQIEVEKIWRKQKKNENK